MTSTRWLTVLAVLLVVPTAVVGQSDLPRTPWGDPDLQGIWANQTPVPLQRPERLGDKAFFTEEEAAEFEKTSLERLVTGFRDFFPVEAELTEGDLLSDVWLETSKGKVSPDRRTSLVIEPPDGQIPYTAAGQQRQAAEDLFDGPQTRPLRERCMVEQGLFVPNPFENNYHHILQTPDHVAVLSEELHEVRIIPLDGGSHVAPPIQLWIGIVEAAGKARPWWLKLPTLTTGDCSEERPNTCVWWNASRAEMPTPSRMS